MINFDTIQTYLLAKKGTTEERPFGPDVLVYKVMGKMFALVPEAPPLRISLKCDPDEALALRDMYTAVQPGYHLNKKHWNTVTPDDALPEDELWRMIDNSYALVVAKLKKAEREQLINSSD
ncbi:MAG TPA: MmcQ/YjbR family DNA-binding protein [Anaerolineae bacterium]|nr:MmcQ/YjbR family DNA-binding protein [Anaerolineae bacterium]